MKPIFHYDIVQGTDEWHDLRKGKITGSVAKTFLVKGRSSSGFGAGAITKMYELAEERMTGIKRESFGGNKATDWGHEYEPEAKEYYSQETFELLHDVGFVSLGDFIGASPDSLVKGKEKGLEAKCLPKEHMKVIETGKYIEDHYVQCQFNLYVTKYEEWDLIYYHPNMPKKAKMKVFTFHPDLELFKKFDERIGEMNRLVNEIIERWKD